jgi:hypothetical protein
MNREDRKNYPSAAKAGTHLAMVAARLKPWPFKALLKQALKPLS